MNYKVRIQKNKDFQMMSADEIRDAVIAIQALKLKMPNLL